MEPQSVPTAPPRRSPHIGWLFAGMWLFVSVPTSALWASERLHPSPPPPLPPGFADTPWASISCSVPEHGPSVCTVESMGPGAVGACWRVTVICEDGAHVAPACSRKLPPGVVDEVPVSTFEEPIRDSEECRTASVDDVVFD